MRALELVDEPVTLELAGILFGERVERQLFERELLLPVRARHDAELRVELPGELLGVGGGPEHRLPERRALVDALDPAALLDGGGVQGLAGGVGQHVRPVDVRDRHAPGARAGGARAGVVVAAATGHDAERGGADHKHGRKSHALYYGPSRVQGFRTWRKNVRSSSAVQLLHVAERHALGPVVDRFALRPARAPQTLAQLVELGGEDLQAERCDRTGHRLTIVSTPSARTRSPGRRRRARRAGGPRDRAGTGRRTTRCRRAAPGS